MKLIIGKDIKIEKPNWQIVKYCEDKLTLTNPDYIIANRLGRYVGRMDKSIKLYVKNGNDLILPYGCIKDIWKLSKGAEYELCFHSKVSSSIKGNIKLYDYQERALKSLLNGTNGILEAPCGSGKTQIGLSLIKEIGLKALWLTHTHKLLNQSLERAKIYYDGDFGVITNGQVHIGKDITFATVQTMRELDTRIYENEFDVVVVDECHHCVGTPTKVMQFYKVLTNCNARFKYGLSATLSRSDSLINCVYSIIGPKLHTITEREVGEKIIKAEHFKVEVPLIYRVLDYCDGDGTLNYSKMIDLLSNDVRRNEMIVYYVKNHLKHRKKQLILCHRLSQIDYLYNQLKEFCKVSKITGKMSMKNRDYDADVIVATYALAKEGLDIPELDCVHFATPQKDKAIVKQSAGRVERNIEGKKVPIILDYVDVNIDYCVSCYKKRVNILK